MHKGGAPDTIANALDTADALSSLGVMRSSDKAILDALKSQNDLGTGD